MATKSSNKAVFLNSLPTPGNGTLFYFDKRKFPGKTLMVKSGSMKRIRCYTGYLKTDSGKNFAFSVMVNHFAGNHPGLVREIENLLFTLKASH
jgi:D-alanyl-D-alanine carboxypeptidase/D-alanyl-D-alanine-endopeptidase (penicillin-binding protein 4)